MNVLLLLLALGSYYLYQSGHLPESVLTEIPAFTQYDPLFHEASAAHNVPWRWIKAVCAQESNYGQAFSVAIGALDPNDVLGSASSDKKSWGLMQLTLPTAQGIRPGVTVAELNDPATSVDLGAAYLSQLMHIFPGDRTSVFRAYNGGPGFVHTALGQRDTPAYAASVENHLQAILAAEPGDEMEIG